MKSAHLLMAALSLVSLSACSFYARGADDYRKATRELLEKKNDSLEACYAKALDETEGAKGTVVVQFEVQAKTGKIVKAKIVEKKTDANEMLQRCVLSALDGLKLDPPDQRTGNATFEWDFARAKR